MSVCGMSVQNFVVYVGNCPKYKSMLVSGKHKVKLLVHLCCSVIYWAYSQACSEF